ncbi:peptidase family M54 [bacterium BMS3Abin07]|nr:peptidase family M54 [bacterium BMS3Abin07]GBE00607.1 peptidase family M54 [bacterium BMS3Abin08]GBE33016.1 peptidase family M54 [bacterium BMS3Bbin05]HDL21123.1 hypothetical protein [Nitrospirota bacterium]HDO22111.1 hypothetical protein [Nitrospirota bacterium]
MGQLTLEEITPVFRLFRGQRSPEEKIQSKTRNDNIHIVSIGVFDKELIDWIGDNISQTFNARINVTNTHFPPCSHNIPKEGQYPASAFIEYLKTIPDGCNKVLGITDTDLSYPGLNYVFGLSDPASQVSIISITRFKGKNGLLSSRQRMIERAIKTTIHELGHTYGLSHCKDHRCVMFFSFNLLDTDYKGKDFCPKCNRELHKILNTV